jgi:hypothetical protein
MSEAHAQSLVRLEAGRLPGVTLWRNNNGVLLNPAGQPVRFGLANESKQLNETLKSSDLIGWRSVVITPHHVGMTLAVFLARECKPAGWRYHENDAHERAQKNWLDLVSQAGGDAAFATGPGTL